MKVTLHEVQYTFWSYLSQFLQNEKCFIQKLCAHFMFSNVLAKIVLFMRYVGKYCRAEKATDDNMALCWIPEATNTHTGVTLIVFPLQQLLQERACV